MAKSPPETQIVLIGASNLARAFPLVVTSLRRGLGGPLNISAAMGHGRSLGAWSRLPGRALPGVIQSDLWRNLDRLGPNGPHPLAAIVDVGNDLMYGAGVARLLGWLEFCLDRLRRRQGEVVLMSLPLESLAELTPRRFELLRKLLFPSHPIPWPLLQERISELDEGMRALGRWYGARWIESSGAWYGFDPIHIRRRDQPRAWQTLFSGWPEWNRAAPVGYPSWPKSLGLRRLRPAERYLFGRRQITPQPVISHSECRVSLF
jgi:hypothetical protein